MSPRFLNSDPATRFALTQAWVTIGGALFVGALGVSARVVPQLRLLHLLQSFIYVAVVVEVIKDFRGDAFRAVYTVRYAGAVYVLHAFQKKSKNGRATARRDMEPIEQGLRDAEEIAKWMKP